MRMVIISLAGWLLTVATYAASPAWWATRGVLVPGATVNDYAAVNQGQVKNMAAQGAAEFNAHLPGGAGPGVTALINSFSVTNNYVPANIGQLKTVAKPFYDRLIAAGYTNAYPWTGTPNDYALGSIGQLKNLFSWDLLSWNLTLDSVGDGIPDWWRAFYFGGDGTTTNAQSCAMCDPDGDGLTNLQEYQHGTNPTKADTDGDGLPDGWEVTHGLNPLDPADARQVVTADGLTYWDLWRMGSDYQDDTSLVRLYVDSQAGAGGDGSVNSPVTTVQAAVDLVPNNDSRIFIIHVGGGTYDENVTITNRRNIMIVGSNAFTTVVSGNEGDRPTITASNFNFLWIKGLTISDGISRTNGAGVLANAPTGNLFVSHCVIRDNFAWQYGGGIWCNVSSNSAVFNSLMTKNAAVTGSCVYVAGGGLNLWHNTLVQNTTDSGNGGAIYAVASGNVWALNCILWQNGGHDTVNTSVQYSDVDPAGGTTGIGDFTSDPNFVSGTLQDYHVHPNSPARSAGASCFVYDDIDAENRPLPSNSPDVGADQYVDTQGNGLPDYWVKFYSFGGLSDVSNPNGDADGDGFTNLQEFNAGTDPTDAGSHPSVSQPSLLISAMESNSLTSAQSEVTESAPAMSALESSSPCPVCVDMPPTSGGLSVGTVTVGQTYHYAESGTICWQSGCPIPTGPDGAGFGAGNYGFKCPGLERYSLVGKLDGGSCFQMGSSGSFTPSTTTNLTIYFNDDVYGDNSRSWHVCFSSSEVASLLKLIDRNDECNYVPDPYGKVDLYKLPENRLYVAQRGSGNFELKIQADLFPKIAGVGAHYVWGVLDNSTENLLPGVGGTLQDDGTADIAFPPAGYWTKIYSVLIGCDQNGDGKLQLSEKIDTPSLLFTVLGVTGGDFEEQETVLLGGGLLVIWPVAANLLRAFVTGNPPLGVSTPTGTDYLPAADSRLTHIAGAPFVWPECNPTIPVYSFPTNSFTARKIAKSKEVDNARNTLLASQAPTVHAIFDHDSSLVSTTLVWTVSLPETAFIFAKSGFILFDDLYYAYAKCGLQMTLTVRIYRDLDTGDLKVASVKTDGVITDLYDYNYEEHSLGEIIRRAATVQIGWQAFPPSPAGGVFYDPVYFWSDRFTFPHF